MKSWEEKLDHVISKLVMVIGDSKFYRTVIASIFARLRNLARYEWNPTKTLKSPTILLKPSAPVLKAEEDYGLSKVSISYALLEARSVPCL
jgi:hypothetical protein